ncbi:MAG: HAD family hydrolase [Clostridia bacterium]|nr:HAD family hydrolase [Clostridia bacterium]
MIKVVLFDLDGTLLPMDQDKFIKAYFGGITKRLENFGYEPKQLISAIWAGTADMIKNDGATANEHVFWKRFVDVFGEKARADEPHFTEFYEEDFDKIQKVCGYNEKASKTICKVKSLGLRTALATNPIFPAIATQKRIKWAGLNVSDFELVTTYENSRFCKPNLEYYKDIIKFLGVEANECVMVGNDVGEDMITKNLGMKVFLLTPNLINKNNEDITIYPHGGYDELLEFLDKVNA